MDGNRMPDSQTVSERMLGRIYLEIVLDLSEKIAEAVPLHRALKKTL